MTELQQTLRVAHDWALDRMDDLYSEERYADIAAIQTEFHEWLDPNIEEHEIFSLEYIVDKA